MQKINVGSVLFHENRGEGIVIKIDEHGRRHVEYSNGEIHKYLPTSWHKIKLVKQGTGLIRNRYKTLNGGSSPANLSISGDGMDLIGVIPGEENNDDFASSNQDVSESRGSKTKIVMEAAKEIFKGGKGSWKDRAQSPFKIRRQKKK